MKKRQLFKLTTFAVATSHRVAEVVLVGRGLHEGHQQVVVVRSRRGRHADAALSANQQTTQFKLFSSSAGEQGSPDTLIGG